jgi:acyl-CoA dehydrogenase
MSDDLATMLSEQAGRLFGDLIDRTLLVAVEHGEQPAALIDAVEAFGLADALTILPEDGGLRFSEVGALFALFGFHAVPLPIGETMLARAVLARAGLDAPEGAIALGDLSVGSASDAPHVLVTREGRLHLLPAGERATTSIARLPRRVIAGGATPVLDGAWPAGLPDALTLGAMLRASQIAGGVARSLALSVDYANDRKQFGKPIGRFQAIQQLLAKLAAEAAAARSAADTAWPALDAGALGYMGAVAKVRTGEAARIACAIAHQVHGAIGVTDEHILHYFTRRLWEWRLDFGSDGAWAAQLGRAVREADGGLWGFLTAGCPTPHCIEELV